MNAPVKPPKRATLEAAIYEPGEVVPDWLVTGEPIPGQPSMLGAVTFSQRCAVLELQGVYVVAPIGPAFGFNVISLGGSQSINFFALEHRVMLLQPSFEFLPRAPLPGVEP